MNRNSRIRRTQAIRLESDCGMFSAPQSKRFGSALALPKGLVESGFHHDATSRGFALRFVQDRAATGLSTTRCGI